MTYRQSYSPAHLFMALLMAGVVSAFCASTALADESPTDQAAIEESALAVDPAFGEGGLASGNADALTQDPEQAGDSEKTVELEDAVSGASFTEDDAAASTITSPAAEDVPGEPFEGTADAQDSASEVTAQIAEGADFASDKDTHLESMPDEPASEVNASDEAANSETPTSSVARDSISVVAQESSSKSPTVSGNCAKAGADSSQTPVDTTADAPARGQLVPDGSYVIKTGVGSLMVLDVAGAQKSRANVVQAAYAGGRKQAWNIAYDAACGLYEVFRMVSGNKLALDVCGGKAKNNANVWLYAANGTKAQRWDIVRGDSSWRLVSALNERLVLEVANSSAKSGANVQLNALKRTPNQGFRLYTTKPQVEKEARVVPDGAYQLVSAASGKVASIQDGRVTKGGNAQVATNDGNVTQRFHLTYHKKGYYEILVVGSGLALDAHGAGLLPGTNVQQYVSNGTAAQRWAIRKAGSGNAYTFVNMANGLALDIVGASEKSGANLQLYTPNGTKAQIFALRHVDHLPEGIFNIESLAAAGRLLDVKNASTKSGAALQLYKANGSLAQVFELQRVGADEYRIRTASSGGWVTAGASVTQSGDHKTKVSKANTWKASWVGGHLVLTSKATGKALTLSGGRTANGTRLVTAKATGAAGQRFTFSAASLLNPGYYVIQSGTGACLSIAGGSSKSGANVQVWAKNGSDAECFYLERSGKGKSATYRIRNAYSGRYLTPEGTGKGANVTQQSSSSAKSQKWVAVIADGGRVAFANAADPSCVLDVARGRSTNGTNVRLWSANQTDAQGWKLAKTNYNPYPAYVRRAIDRANGSSSSTGYLVVVDKSNTRVIVMTGGNGNWRPARNMACSVGAYNTPTVEGTFTVGSRGYSFGSGYTCYYWTQFYADYLFHSVLYNEGTRTIQDGRLGYHISHGCVRMDIGDAYWIYDTIPSGTRVLVYS